MRHPTDKIELIIMGGTFLAYPKSYQYNFIKSCYDALNNRVSKTLEQAKKLNETAEHRCIALCIETRPDICTAQDIKRLLEFGCTRVELGVQMPSDFLYTKTNRGHTVKQVIDATERLKNANFKVFYHIMPGLPGSNLKKDLKLFKELFSNESFRPDGLKIYPCQVIYGSELQNLWKQGKYNPYTKQELIKLLIEFKKLVPRYCRIMRVMREIPPDFLVSGIHEIDLRKVVQDEMKKQSISCKCIRCREIGFRLRDKSPKERINQDLNLKVTKYRASNGTEYFIEFVNKDDVLFGLCRLRVRKEKNNRIYGAIRELHVYGQSLQIGKREDRKEIIQHKGLGKQLVQKAEEIAKAERVKELDVIAGIGVREYFYKLGYKLNKPYVTKKL